MHTFQIIEEDRGTITGTRHRHNGYYAGDFDAHPEQPFPRPGSFAVVCTALHPSEQRAA